MKRGEDQMTNGEKDKVEKRKRKDKLERKAKKTETRKNRRA